MNLRKVIVGSSSEYGTEDGGDYFKTTIGKKFTTDLEISEQITKGFSLSVGANNLFNVYPDKMNPQLVAAQRAGLDNAAVQKYPSFSPIGINGGYCYAKADFTFRSAG